LCSSSNIRVKLKSRIKIWEGGSERGE
jgi:hypothetical protein